MVCYYSLCFLFVGFHVFYYECGWYSTLSAEVSDTVCIMKVGRQHPMSVHDVVGEFSPNYPHYDSALLIAQCLHEENCTILQHHKYRMLNFRQIQMYSGESR